MTTSSTPGSLPCLALMYTPRETFLFDLIEAGAGLWTTVCIVDQLVAEVPLQTMRVLPRMVTVVDITGLSLAERADRISQYRPAGILALDDGRLEATAAIAELLGLRFHSLDTVKLLTNKTAQRQAFAEAGLTVPRFWSVSATTSTAERDRMIDDVRLPAIVKPQMGVSSRNTVIAADRNELARLVEELLPREPAGLVVEEFIPDGWRRDEKPVADYVSVESIVSDGTAVHIMVTGNFPLTEPFRESGHIVPAEVTPEQRTQILECASAAIKAVHIEVGAVHTEIKLSPEGPRVIEVNGRIAGLHIPQLVQLAAGISLFRLAGLAALGMPLDLPAEISCSQSAYVLVCHAPVEAEAVRETRGAQEVAKMPGVRGVHLNKEAGESVDWREGTDGFVWMVEGTAPDAVSLHDIVSQIKETLTFDVVLAETA
jgi:biotin carboxylase